MICSVQDCDRLVIARGWCNAHYQRWRTHGNPTAGGTMQGAPHKALSEIQQIDTNECVIWAYGKRADGYGAITLGGTSRLVHIVVCEVHHGRRPHLSYEVAHSCGNPSCVNWRHLRWATAKENSADRIRHGHTRRGEHCNFTKLTVDQVHEIRRRAGTQTNNSLATEFGVSEGAIREVISHKSWAWLDVDTYISPPPAA